VNGSWRSRFFDVACFLPLLACYTVAVVLIVAAVINSVNTQIIVPQLWSILRAAMRSFVTLWKTEESAVVQNLKGNKTHLFDGTPRYENEY